MSTRLRLVLSEFINADALGNAAVYLPGPSGGIPYTQTYALRRIEGKDGPSV
jgi:hypothetical protein